MTHSETRRYEMLLRVSEFGKNHPGLFPADTLAGQALAVVDVAVKQLGQQAVTKMSVKRGGKHSKAMARQALVERLEAVSRCARVIAEDTPGFDEPLQLPSPRSDQALLAAGRVFAREAEARRSRFAAYGMPDTYLTCLGQLADDFEQAIRTRQAGLDGHTAARAAIESALASGVAAVRKLDVIVPLLLHDDPVTRAVWEGDRRIDYFHRAKRGASKAKATEVQPDATAGAEPKTPGTALKVAS